MVEVEPEQLEARQLGRRLRNARQQAGSTADECAHALGMTVEAYRAAEEGHLALSLPQLEALAMVLGVPLSVFWSGNGVKRTQPDGFSDYLMVRDRMIGVRLQQARLAAGMTRADLAGALGIDESGIEAYEWGRTTIPLPDLVRLADRVGMPLDAFIEEQAKRAASREVEQDGQSDIEHLASHLQTFIVNPAQARYVEAAYRLSQIDSGQLRRLAQLLLDITPDGGST